LPFLRVGINITPNRCGQSFLEFAVKRQSTDY
jgi:hypothetical protein